MGKPEEVILVDAHNRRIGSGEKLHVHREGLLHRAFSIFLVDGRGAIVLQKRNPGKYHSGGLWANTCCGHPRPGEATIAGARRRLCEEVGVRAELKLAFRSRYAVTFGNGLSENEIVNVYCGTLAGELRPDPSEVVDLAFMPLERLVREAEREPASYAYWLHHYLANHRRELERALDGAAHGAPQPLAAA
ncbi:MAG TPA: isopentenyl-diphosphate Delta-isomerase [Beijerinckiaceae bacterium]|jgi:isopentenyl-diphosphate delta-isomerase